jgi:hypothetical protein
MTGHASILPPRGQLAALFFVTAHLAAAAAI